MNRRSESRLLLELPGSYLVAGRSEPVYFSQLSANGCRLGTCALKEGQRIELHLGPIGPLGATVRWAGNNAVGVQFEVPLDAAVVSYFAGFVAKSA